MTTINPAAESAREAARDTGGQFGNQEHSAPESNLVPTQTHEQVLSELYYIHGSDSMRADAKGRQVRVEGFVADAQRAVPDAVAAQFVWDHDYGASRLVFGAYLDEDGQEIELDFEDYPDDHDFDFTDNKDARAYGFESTEKYDGATLRFAEITVRDEATARAQLSTATKLRHHAHEQELRTLLFSAMGGDDAVSAERLDRLTGYDLEQVEAIFQDALRSNANYLRHS